MRFPLLAGLLFAAAAQAAIEPARLVPMRWQFADPAALSLLQGSAVNCLLMEPGPESPALAEAAGKRDLLALGIVRPGPDAARQVQKLLDAKARGIVLEGDFPAPLAARLRGEIQGRNALLVEITPATRMNFGSQEPILATTSGVWPGIEIQDDGKSKAGPTGSAWINTNMGLLQAARMMSGGAQIWLGIRPPEKQVILPERYLQAVADAAAAGAHWIISLDSNLTAALSRQDPRAVKTWNRIAALTTWFEQHPLTRDLPPGGKFAILQDEQHGALISGGIMDMISTKHTPVRPVSPALLSPRMLDGVSITLNVEPEALTPAQKDVLRTWQQNGGRMLTAPAGWQDAFGANSTANTLDAKQLKLLDAMWQEVSDVIGRRNLGVRLFNVSSVLSSFHAAPAGRPAVVALVNYADYPIDNITVHLLGKFTSASLYLPDGKEKDLEVYDVQDGTGVDIDSVASCAILRVQ